MISPPSDSSSGDRRSAAFERLNPYVQKWIWSRKWDALKDVQEAAINVVLDAVADLVIAAPTASGKTEAAFLPICSQMIDAPTDDGIRALYISPLKALINDQYERLSDLFGGADISVTRWHGDVSGDEKDRLWQNPRGILLITPESIEAMFVTRGYSVASMFRGLQWIVVDELHAYLDTSRGKQVQSLLHRVEVAAGRDVLRIGLSATLGDMSMAAEFLRPGHGTQTRVLVSESDGQELLMQVKAYAGAARNDHTDETTPANPADPTELITDQLFRVLRGKNHLVFANSRRAVETYADRLRGRCERERVPNEFFPHHGNLSKALREDVENRLKDPSLPTTAICTSTLELGIDVGQVVSIGQIGAPFSVAAIRQRLGRSGRRGDPAILRMHITTPDATESDRILDGLAIDLVQAIAIVELLIARWCEPPDPARAHLSTLVHQTLSLIAERGGVKAKVAWTHLCKDGAFRSVDSGLYSQLLRRMGQEDLVAQSGDGDLVHGGKGERIVNHFGFFAVFESPEEFRIVCDGHALGTVSVDHALVEGIHIIFAGRRWRVISVDRERKVIAVSPAPGGRVPMFDPSQGGLVHDTVRREMLKVYRSTTVPRYLDAEGVRLLDMARRRYRELRLHETPLLQDGKNVVLFACRGDRIVNTLAVILAGAGYSTLQMGPAIVLIDATVDAAQAELRSFMESSVGAQALAAMAHNKRHDKYDWALSDEMLGSEYACRALDVPGTQDVAREWARAGEEMPTVTKALFFAARACATQSWLAARTASSASVGDQKRMREGQEVAKLARERYLDGIFVTKLGSESAAQATKRLLMDSSVNVLFEATFETNGLVARADILVREAEGWRLIEVKAGKAQYVSSKTENGDERVELGAKREYVADLAYTLMVIRHSGVEPKGASLLLLNPEYRLGSTDANLFAEVECWDEADFIAREFWVDSEAAVSALRQGTPPSPVWNTSCRGCDYFTDRCLGRGRAHPITEIPRLREAKMREILEAGAVEVADVPDHIDLGDNASPTSPPGNRVRACVRSGKAFVSEGLAGALGVVEWPAHYLDFETFATAIPVYGDTAPWETIPGQYSLHVQNERGGNIAQGGYIVADPSHDCRRDLAGRLIADLGKQGSVLTYSGFEARIIEGLAVRCPDLREQLRLIAGRIVDLCEIIATHCYHPEFRGRVSIKVVLPVLVSGLDYSDLEIADGDAASAVLADAAQGLLSPEEWARRSKQLYDYCERDTLAMVRVHEALLAMSEV